MGAEKLVGVLGKIRNAIKAAEIPTAAEQVTHLPVPFAQGKSLAEVPQAVPAVKGALQQAQPVLAKEAVNLGRRKFLKQAAASAVRTAVPDSISKPLVQMAMKEVASPVVEAVTQVIPLESRQAAVSGAVMDLLKKYPDLIEDPWKLSEVLDISPSSKLGRQMLSGPHLDDEFADVYKLTHETLSPKAIAEASGLPLEAITEHIGPGGEKLHSHLRELAGMQNSLEAFGDNTWKHKVQDYGFDQLPSDPEIAGQLRQKLAEFNELNNQLYSEDLSDKMFYLSDDIRGLYEQGHMDQSVKAYDDLFGAENLSTITDTTGWDHPYGATQQMLEDILMEGPEDLITILNEIPK